MPSRKILALAALAILLFPSFGIVAGAEALTVYTDASTYESGEDVEIQVSGDPYGNVSILVVFNSTLETMIDVNVTLNGDGENVTVFELGEEASPGMYNVTVSAGEVEAEAFFTVTQPEPEDPEPEEDPEEDVEAFTASAEEALGLKANIERAERFIQKILDAKDRLEDRGYTVGDPSQYIEDARGNLTLASEALESLDISTGAKYYAVAKGTLGRTMGWLHSTAVKVKTFMAERFMQQVELRLHSLEGRIRRLQDRPAKEKVILNMLSLKEKYLSKARQRLEAGGLDEAIAELEALAESINVELGELNGEGNGVMLRYMDKLEAKLRTLNATVGRMKNKGVDTSEAEEALGNAETLMEQAMQQMEEGYTEEAQTLLEDAETQLTEAAAIIKNLNKQQSVQATNQHQNSQGDE